jgi:hypothetical protein
MAALEEVALYSLRSTCTDRCWAERKIAPGHQIDVAAPFIAWKLRGYFDQLVMMTPDADYRHDLHRKVLLCSLGLSYYRSFSIAEVDLDVVQTLVERHIPFQNVWPIFVQGLAEEYSLENTRGDEILAKATGIARIMIAHGADLDVFIEPEQKSARDILQELIPEVLEGCHDVAHELEEKPEDTRRGDQDESDVQTTVKADEQELSSPAAELRKSTRSTW